MARLSLLTLGILSFLAISTCSGGPADPSYKECQPHIDATIRNLAAKAVHAGEVPSEEEAKEFVKDLEPENEDDDDDDEEGDEESPPEPPKAPPTPAPPSKKEPEQKKERAKPVTAKESTPEPSQPKHFKEKSYQVKEGIAKVRQGKEMHAKKVEVDKSYLTKTKDKKSWEGSKLKPEQVKRKKVEDRIPEVKHKEKTRPEISKPKEEKLKPKIESTKPGFPKKTEEKKRKPEESKTKFKDYKSKPDSSRPKQETVLKKTDFKDKQEPKAQEKTRTKQEETKRQEKTKPKLVESKTQERSQTKQEEAKKQERIKAKFEEAKLKYQEQKIKFHEQKHTKEEAKRDQIKKFPFKKPSKEGQKEKFSREKESNERIPREKLKPKTSIKEPVHKSKPKTKTIKTKEKTKKPISEASPKTARKYTSKKIEPQKYDKQKHASKQAIKSDKGQPKVEKQHHAKPKASEDKAKLGIFDKFIDVIFGFPKEQRNPKYAQPWSTHPEFAKKDKGEAQVKKPVSKVYSPGIVARGINYCVDKIFGLPKAKRNPKYAEPWQTHPEFKRDEKEKEEVKKVKKSEESRLRFIGTFFNKFVDVIFGKNEATRDPKYAQPWQSHKEHIRAPKEKERPVEKKKAVNTQGWGICNYLVSLVFEVSKVKRDPKWNEPWQTHKENIREPKAVVKEVPKAKQKANIFSEMINKCVYIIFGKFEAKRDKKWKEPWQTHKEFQKAKKEPAEKKITPSKKESGIIGKAINSFVELIFGETKAKRDSKWADPWQTHAPTKGKKQAPPSPKKEELRKVPPPKEEPPKATRTPPPHPPKETQPKPQQQPKQEPPKVKTPPPHKESRPPPPSRPPKERSRSPSRSPSPPPTKKHYEEAKRPHESKTERVPTQKEDRKHVVGESFPSDTPSAPRKPAKKEPSPAPVADAPKTTGKQILDKEKKSKIYDDDDEQIVLVPSSFRSREHIDSILGLDEISRLASQRTAPIAEPTLKDLKGIYDSAVKPLETLYKYQDISNRHLSDAEIFGRPLVLLLGPYSTGKSTFLNYLLGIEFTKRALKTGTPPSHGVFRIVQYGNQDRDLDGTEVSGQGSFMSLQKFGQNFVDQVYGKALNVKLLKKVTFVEAPGILEMRRAGERLYPFNDVIQWFIDRADLILVMFDYTKLDAGYELEAVLDQLKGREAQTRILLNKADQVPPEELIKVQGSLFWNLSPLFGVSAPPTVYAGSFASRPYRTSSPVKLFQAQEEALLHDLAKALHTRVDNRIAITRRHAVRVRNHAQMVDTYLTTFYRNKGFLTSKHKLAEDIINNPHSYNIYEGVSLLTNISRYDLPDSDVYRDFFRIHNLYEFRTLRETCTYIGGCPLDKIDAAISVKLPELMVKFKRLVEAANPGTPLPSAREVNHPNYDERVAHVHTRTL